jgi:pyruvate kinase
MNRTRIICTLGPSSQALPVLEGMAGAGMDVARINCSHGSRAQHRLRLHNVNELNKRCGTRVKRLLDLQGHRIRVRLPERNRQLELAQNDSVLLVRRDEASRKNSIAIDYPGALEDIPEGSLVYIDDGSIALKVKKRRGTAIVATVVVPGIVRNGKGVNIPGADLKFGSLSDRDKADMELAATDGVDFVAQSFVHDADDIVQLRRLAKQNGARCKLIAKIESREAIDNLDEILRVSDGIMVARGDMGVSVPIYQVPVLQKMIIARCRSAGRFVITATQMLESMTVNSRPTRAEVSDVANAVIDGSNYVMLSGETAIGKHPVETVRMMRQIVQFTERYLAEPTKRVRR